MNKIYKLVVGVPMTHADQVRKALGDAGAGVMGNYTHCSFSYSGIGRFIPQDGANPAIGKIGQLEQVQEERIETVCEYDKLEAVIKAVKAAHPYEHPPIEYWQINKG